MIIDLILDRKDGEPYNPKDFYTNVLAYEDTFNFEPAISKAMDYGDEEDVKRALCDYINRQNYNPSICDYINSVNWLTSSKKAVKSSCRAIKSEMSSRQYQNAIDKASRMIDEGERNVGAICKKTSLDEGDVQAMINDWEELESITSSRKLIKSERDKTFWNISNGYLTGNEVIKIMNKIDDWCAHRALTHSDIRGYSDNDVTPDEASDNIHEIITYLEDLSYRLDEYNMADDEDIQNGDFDDLLPMIDDTENLCKKLLTEETYSRMYNDIFKDLELLGNRDFELQSSRRPIKSSDKPWKGKKWDIYRPGIDEPYVTEDFDEMMGFKQDGFKVKLHKEEPVNQSFIVGKTMNDGSKLYYCEDNCFYDENNYTRPAIKIFKSKQEADKIAKRSKSGFVSPLEK